MRVGLSLLLIHKMAMEIILIIWTFAGSLLLKKDRWVSFIFLFLFVFIAVMYLFLRDLKKKFNKLWSNICIKYNIYIKSNWIIFELNCSNLNPPLHTHAHKHNHTYAYIRLNVCVCLCVCDNVVITTVHCTINCCTITVVASPCDIYFLWNRVTM